MQNRIEVEIRVFTSAGACTDNAPSSDFTCPQQARFCVLCAMHAQRVNQIVIEGGRHEQ